MQNFSDNLNGEQKLAVTSTDGPLLILAGAGSGKTRVLTHRIAHILDQKLAYPEQILAVTFTNKAANEMKERVERLIGKQIRVPWIGTFHSICIRILRREGHLIGLNPQFTIYDSNDQLSLVKDSMDKLMIDKKAVNPKAVLHTISNAKNELINSIKFESYAEGYFQQKVAPIYREYQKTLEENQSLDFDDIIMKTVILFQKNKDILEKYQQLFKYIHVDEYQDTNHAQYVLVNLLADDHKNICVVGDDDQSIYSWRGATIKNILNFEEDYPETKTIKLEQNYRSTKKILEASHSIIRANRNRKEKNLWTDNSDGEDIMMYTALDEKDEALFVAQRINNLIQDSDTPDDIAILYRMNAQSRILEEILLRAGIPYRIIGNVRFYDRREVKDILAYLKLIFNPDDDLSLKRIINIPPRGIGPKTFQTLEESAQMNGQSLLKYLIENRNSQKKGVHTFGNIAEDFLKVSQEKNVYDLIKYILDKSDYLRWMEENKEENSDRIENIQELLTLAAEFKDLSPNEGLSQFLEKVSLYQAQDSLNDDDNRAVTLMTIHAAKGLEFKHVFLVGMEEGIFPHSMSYTDPKEMEEERRLAYVAITRAKNVLHVTHAQRRTFFGSSKTNPISRFVDEIPQDIITAKSYSDSFGGNMLSQGFSEVTEDHDDIGSQSIALEKGMNVSHAVFGKGRVVDFDDSTVTVNFSSAGVKELLIEYARLSKA